MSLEEVSKNSKQEISPKFEIEENLDVLVVAESDNNVSYWNGCHVFTILAVCTLCLCPQMLNPRHDSIIYQSYWLEVNELMVFTGLMVNANLILDFFAFTRQEFFTTVGFFVKMYLWLLITWHIPFIACNSFWKYYLNFNTPMPLSGLLFLVTWLAVLLGVWLMFPSETLAYNEVRAKMKTYFLYSLWWNIMNLQKDAITIAFKNVPNYLQWIFAFLIPVLRNCNKSLLSRLVSKMSGDEDEMANIVLGISVNVHYAFLISVRFAGADMSTVISLMVVDFLLHLGISFKIIQLHQKVAIEEDDQEQLKKDKEKALLKLVLAETIEGLAPLAYAIGFAMAYFGPNKNITCNVGSTIWHCKEVEDVDNLFIVLFSLFAADIFSMLLNALVLWKFTGIVFIQELCKVIKKYKSTLAIKLAYTVCIYFVFNDINLGMDMSLKFTWITNEGRLNFIYNSTNLSDDEKSCLLANATLT